MSTTLSLEQRQALCTAAIKGAKEAGLWIERYDRTNLQRNFKNAGSSAASQIVTAVDTASEEIIRRHLQPSCESLNIAFIGEESSVNTPVATNERFEKPYFWCVDPLDGTLPFTKGRSGYAVSIALLDQTGTPLIGVVYDPAHQVLLHAISGEGCYRNLAPFPNKQRSSKSLMVYADASFKTHEKYQSARDTLKKCAHSLNLDGVTFVYGSGAVINACEVLNSDQACYLKLPKKEDGGGSIWDFAATACIASELGAWVSDIHGHPLALNRRDSTFMNQEGILYASNSQIAQLLIGML